MRFSAVDGFNKVEITRWAKAHLTPKSIVISAGLACFRAVKDAEMLHLAVVTGGGPESVEWPYFKWVNTMISNVKNSMHGTYHTINQKHLEFCFKFNRRFNLKNMLEQLIVSSIRTALMPQRLTKLAEVRRW